MPQYTTPVTTFRGVDSNRSTQSGTGSFIAAPPNYSKASDQLAATLGAAIGNGLTKPGPNEQQQASAALDAQKLKDLQTKAAADKNISDMVASHVAAKRSLGQSPNLQEIEDEVIPEAIKGGYKPDELTKTVLGLVANYGDQGDPNYDNKTTAAGVANFGPLAKDSSYSLGRHKTILQDDADQKAADRVAIEEGENNRNAATNATSRANNTATVAAENTRAANSLKAQTDKEELENTRKSREGYKDPKVLGDLIDQSLGATPQGKKFDPATDTQIDPMVRAGILARASELVDAGNTRENAVLQAIKEKGATQPAKSGFWGFGSKPAQFSPVADAAAKLTAPPPAAPPAPSAAPAGPKKRVYNPATGRIE